MPVLTLTIMGPPLGKGRPRFNKASGHAYTPKTTAEWEGAARGEMAAQLPHGWTPLDEPVGLYVCALYPRPQSMTCSHTSGRCKCEERHPAEAFLPYPGKPDGDNVEKLAWDAAEKAGVVADDKLVVVHGGRHRYLPARVKPRVELTVVWGADLARLVWPPSCLEEW